jgi:hypothetical protein
MTWNSLRAARFVSICLLCLTAQTPIFSAQEPDTPASEIFGPPRYEQTKSPDGAIRYTDREMGLSFTMPSDWGLGNDGLRFMDRGWKGNGEGDIATTSSITGTRTRASGCTIACFATYIG